MYYLIGILLLVSANSLELPDHYEYVTSGQIDFAKVLTKEECDNLQVGVSEQVDIGADLYLGHAAIGCYLTESGLKYGTTDWTNPTKKENAKDLQCRSPGCIQHKVNPPAKFGVGVHPEVDCFFNDGRHELRPCKDNTPIDEQPCDLVIDDSGLANEVNCKLDGESCTHIRRLENGDIECIRVCDMPGVWRDSLCQIHGEFFATLGLSEDGCKDLNYENYIPGECLSFTGLTPEREANQAACEAPSSETACLCNGEMCEGDYSCISVGAASKCTLETCLLNKEISKSCLCDDEILKNGFCYGTYSSSFPSCQNEQRSPTCSCSAGIDCNMYEYCEDGTCKPTCSFGEVTKECKCGDSIATVGKYCLYMYISDAVYISDYAECPHYITLTENCACINAAGVEVYETTSGSKVCDNGKLLDDGYVAEIGSATCSENEVVLSKCYGSDLDECATKEGVPDSCTCDSTTKTDCVSEVYTALSVDSECCEWSPGVDGSCASSLITTEDACDTVSGGVWLDGSCILSTITTEDACDLIQGGVWTSAIMATCATKEGVPDSCTCDTTTETDCNGEVYTALSVDNACCDWSPTYTTVEACETEGNWRVLQCEESAFGGVTACTKQGFLKTTPEHCKDVDFDIVNSGFPDATKMLSQAECEAYEQTQVDTVFELVTTSKPVGCSRTTDTVSWMATDGVNPTRCTDNDGCVQKIIYSITEATCTSGPNEWTTKCTNRYTGNELEIPSEKCIDPSGVWDYRCVNGDEEKTSYTDENQCIKQGVWSPNINNNDDVCHGSYLYSNEKSCTERGYWTTEGVCERCSRCSDKNYGSEIACETQGIWTQSICVAGPNTYYDKTVADCASISNAVFTPGICHSRTGCYTAAAGTLLEGGRETSKSVCEADPDTWDPHTLTVGDDAEILTGGREFSRQLCQALPSTMVDTGYLGSVKVCANDAYTTSEACTSKGIWVAQDDAVWAGDQATGEWVYGICYKYETSMSGSCDDTAYTTRDSCTTKGIWDDKCYTIVAGAVKTDKTTQSTCEDDDGIWFDSARVELTDGRQDETKCTKAAGEWDWRSCTGEDEVTTDECVGSDVFNTEDDCNDRGTWVSRPWSDSSINQFCEMTSFETKDQCTKTGKWYGTCKSDQYSADRNFVSLSDSEDTYQYKIGLEHCSVKTDAKCSDETDAILSECPSKSNTANKVPACVQCPQFDATNPGCGKKGTWKSRADVEWTADGNAYGCVHAYDPYNLLSLTTGGYEEPSDDICDFPCYPAGCMTVVSAPYMQCVDDNDNIIKGGREVSKVACEQSPTGTNDNNVCTFDPEEYCPFAVAIDPTICNSEPWATRCAKTCCPLVCELATLDMCNDLTYSDSHSNCKKTCCELKGHDDCATDIIKCKGTSADDLLFQDECKQTCCIVDEIEDVRDLHYSCTLDNESPPSMTAYPESFQATSGTIPNDYDHVSTLEQCHMFFVRTDQMTTFEETDDNSGCSHDTQNKVVWGGYTPHHTCSDANKCILFKEQEESEDTGYLEPKWMNDHCEVSYAENNNGIKCEAPFSSEESCMTPGTWRNTCVLPAKHETGCTHFNKRTSGIDFQKLNKGTTTLDSGTHAENCQIECLPGSYTSTTYGHLKAGCYKIGDKDYIKNDPSRCPRNVFSDGAPQESENVYTTYRDICIHTRASGDCTVPEYTNETSCVASGKYKYVYNPDTRITSCNRPGAHNVPEYYNDPVYEVKDCKKNILGITHCDYVRTNPDIVDGIHGHWADYVCSPHLEKCSNYDDGYLLTRARAAAYGGYIRKSAVDINDLSKPCPGDTFRILNFKLCELRIEIFVLDYTDTDHLCTRTDLDWDATNNDCKYKDSTWSTDRQQCEKISKTCCTSGDTDNVCDDQIGGNCYWDRERVTGTIEGGGEITNFVDTKHHNTAFTGKLQLGIDESIARVEELCMKPTCLCVNDDGFDNNQCSPTTNQTGSCSLSFSQCDLWTMNKYHVDEMTIIDDPSVASGCLYYMDNSQDEPHLHQKVYWNEATCVPIDGEDNCDCGATDEYPGQCISLMPEWQKWIMSDLGPETFEWVDGKCMVTALREKNVCPYVCDRELENFVFDAAGEYFYYYEGKTVSKEACESPAGVWDREAQFCKIDMPQVNQPLYTTQSDCEGGTGDAPAGVWVQDSCTTNENAAESCACDSTVETGCDSEVYTVDTAQNKCCTWTPAYCVYEQDTLGSCYVATGQLDDAYDWFTADCFSDDGGILLDGREIDKDHCEMTTETAFLPSVCKDSSGNILHNLVTETQCSVAGTWLGGHVNTDYGYCDESGVTEPRNSDSIDNRDINNCANPPGIWRPGKCYLPNIATIKDCRDDIVGFVHSETSTILGGREQSQVLCEAPPGEWSDGTCKMLSLNEPGKDGKWKGKSPCEDVSGVFTESCVSDATAYYINTNDRGFWEYTPTVLGKTLGKLGGTRAESREKCEIPSLTWTDSPFGGEADKTLCHYNEKETKSSCTESSDYEDALWHEGTFDGSTFAKITNIYSCMAAVGTSWQNADSHASSHLGICKKDNEDITYDDRKLQLYYYSNCLAEGGTFEGFQWGKGYQCNEYGYSCNPNDDN